MSDNTASQQPEQPKDQDEVEALVDDLEVHGFDTGLEATDGCSGVCTNTCS